MKKTTILSVAFFAFFPFAFVNSFACDCITTYPYTASLEEKVKIARSQTDAIFSGKVLAISVGRGASGNIKVKFRVDKIWKGELPEIITIVTHANSGLCGYGFKKSKLYLVYSSKADEKTFSTNNCSRTQEIVGAKDELKILGQEEKPKKKFASKN